MNQGDLNWKLGLDDLFSATVNQEPLEEAAKLMVSVSSVNSGYHDQCLFVLDSAIASAEKGERKVIESINMSGFLVDDIDGALELLREFRSIYLDTFARATGSPR
jgi:hypothetical protein